MQRAEDFLGAERLDDAVPFKICAQVGADAAHHHVDLPILQLRQKIAKGPPGGKVDVRERASVDHETAHRRRRRGDQLARLVCEAVDVGVKQIGAEAIDD